MGLVVIVEGLIGAGKSTLTQELGNALGPDTLIQMEPDEQGNANPYLADFYADKKRWAFPMQVELLSLRYRMQLLAQWHVMNGQGYAVTDRSYFGDTCFARLMNKTGDISDREFDTYKNIYQIMTASILLPSVCVRLCLNPETAAERIRSRASIREGRRSELVIDLGYLTALDAEIDTTVKILEQQGVRVINIDWNANRDTPESRAPAIQKIADTIHSMSPPDLFQLHKRLL